MGGRLEGKAAVVTGGGGPNLGRELTRRLAEEGADVIVGDLDVDGARAGANEVKALGRKARALRADVGRERDCDRLVDAAIETFGRLDIAVASAAWGYEEQSTLDRPLDEWERMLRTALTGVMLTDRACAARMIAEGWAGCIVNVSSAAQAASPQGTHYGAAKAGVWHLTKALGLELAGHGIRVNAVVPGWMVSPERYEANRSFYRKLERTIPLRRVGTPRDVANVVVFLASDEASYITGESIWIDGGLHADKR